MTDLTPPVAGYALAMQEQIMADPEPQDPTDAEADIDADGEQSGAGYGNHMPTDPKAPEEDDVPI